MDTKLIEIRDEGTHIPALAIQLTRDDGYPAARAGFSKHPHIILVDLNSNRSQDDSNKWPPRDGRTLRMAHNFLETNWSQVEHNGVLDVRFIMGETTAPAPSDQKEYTRPVLAEKS